MHSTHTLLSTRESIAEPWIGMHGSFVVCQNAVEQAVGFDHGLAGSITEDAYFALAARSSIGVRFSWINALMFEQSPFGLMDFVQQRRRWYGGLWLVCKATAIPLKQRAVLTAMTFSWALSFFVGGKCPPLLSRPPLAL